MKRTIRIGYCLVVFLLLFLFSAASLTGQENGIIRGTITDSESGETLIGVNIVLQGTTTGTITDFDGKYSLEVEPGTQTVVFSYVSYTTQTVTDVEVNPDEVTVLNINLAPASVDIDEVVVTAQQINNTENAVLSMQKRAEAVQDGISAIEMKKFGSSDAAESMVKVTGVSVVDGKDIVVRGLGDRYSNVQMDGQDLPGTDPYKNSADLDLIPANLLDNIVTVKTFTPDKPGSFSGGNVNIQTKSFPDKFTFNFSVGASYNDQSTFNKDFLTFEGGDLDWLGINDGYYDLPKVLSQYDTVLTRSVYILARNGNEELANIIDTTAKSLNPQMVPETQTTPLNQKISLSLGNQYQLFGKPLGLLGAMNFKRNYSFYDDGKSANWELATAGADSLGEEYVFNDTKATENPQINALGLVAFKYSSNGSIEIKHSYNQDAEKTAQVLDGIYPAALSGSARFTTRGLNFIERSLNLTRLSGHHVFPSLNNTRIDYSGSKVTSRQDQPDLRFFANSYYPSKSGTSYDISGAEYDNPFHFWRELEDNKYQGSIDITIPFLQSQRKSNKIKFGYYTSDKERDFTEFSAQIRNYQGEPYKGADSAHLFFGPENSGIIRIDTTSSGRVRYYTGTYAIDNSSEQNTYTGNEEISAFYFMVNYTILSKLQVIAGARYESTFMDATSQAWHNADSINKPKYRGEIDAQDWLPSLNLVYELTDEMNLRASYSRTLARPNLREIAPFASFDFIGAELFNGNPRLKKTDITNYDFRWEWFVRPGELLAFSAYYKDFKNPIIKQRLIKAANPQIQMQNSKEGFLVGAEIEFRKYLDFITPRLEDFNVGFNLSLTRSEVKVDSAEYRIANERNPEIEDTRPFPGQSPYLVNLNFGYDNPDIGFNATLAYNKFGDRLSYSNVFGTPDVYESNEGNLNLTVRKTFAENFRFGFEISNILDSDFRRKVEYKGGDYDFLNYQTGRTYSISLSYVL